jgi:hypothetical protein
MSKVVLLRPDRGHIRPVLVLLTSHRLDCLLLCLRSLERFTSLARFKNIYVVANAVSQDHAAILNNFRNKNANVEVIHCSPRGLMPAVNTVQNAILAEHAQDVVVKLDEDVFVTPHWLEHMLDAYRVHMSQERYPIVSAMCPVSPPGRFALNRFLKTAYPAERSMFEGEVVEENWVYHRWMWQKVVGEDLVKAFLKSSPPPFFYPGFATINCVMFDSRLIQTILPLPTEKRPGQPNSDEEAINRTLRAQGWKAVVVSRAVAHHYSFAKCEKYLRAHVPLDLVWEYLQELHKNQLAQAGLRMAQGQGPRLRQVGGLGAR